MEKFEILSKEELLKIISRLRNCLEDCEDADDFCLFAAEILDLDLKASR